MKSLIVLLSFILCVACYAQDTEESVTFTESQLNLKNYGFSYCLTKGDNSLKSEASLAMGGYFQNGEHNELAYKNIKQFINMNINYSVYKESVKVAILTSCLDLYNSNKYKIFIVQQNKHLISD